MTQPGLIWASKLWLAGACPARFVAEHRRDVWPAVLPATLPSIRGRLVHAVIEDLANHSDRDAGALRAHARDRFTVHRDSLAAALSAEPWHVAHFDLISKLPWASISRTLLPLASAEAARPARPRASTGSAPEQRTSYIGAVPGTEVPFVSWKLGIAGRIDAIRDSGGSLEVIDLKTGRLTNLRAAGLQVRAYALAVELLADRPVGSVAVETATRRLAIPWDDESREETAEAIATARRLLRRPAKPVAAVENCRGCPVRHRCDEYRVIAPTWWGLQNLASPPPDVWGSVLTVTARERERTVTIRRPTGEPCRVTGVPEERSVAVDHYVEVFGLERTGSRRFPAGTGSDANLHEMATRNDMRPAWGTVWFYGSQRCQPRIAR